MGQWRCRVEGRESGPVDDDGLRAMAADGRLHPADEVWNPATNRWGRAGRMCGLFPPVPPGASVPGQPHVKSDAGPFHRVGGRFRVGGRRRTWEGHVVASPAAIYLVKGSDDSEPARPEALPDGRADDVRSCGLPDLPADMQVALDPRGNYPEADVIVLPRGAVSLVRVPWFGSTVRVECGGDTFHLLGPALGMGAVRRFLRRSGWAVNGPVEPTEAPAHAGGRNDEPADEVEAGPGPWARLAYLAIAVAIVASVAYVRGTRPARAAASPRGPATESFETRGADVGRDVEVGVGGGCCGR